MRNDKINQIEDIMAEVYEGNAEYVLTIHGQPAAVLIGYEAYEGLIETVKRLDVDDTVNYRSAEADIRDGRVIDLDYPRSWSR